MSLGDPGYFAFLAVVFVGFHSLKPGRPRRVWLLLASYFFYFQFSQYYIGALLFVTIVTYRGALLIGRLNQTNSQSSGVFWLVMAIVAAPLLTLRYGAALMHGKPGWEFLPATIPVGISFFTFVALGYLADVYLGMVDPEADPSKVALLLAFFPLISAGPIERAGRFVPQFDMNERFSSKNAIEGFELIFIGLILKLLIATLLEGPASGIMAAPHGLKPVELLGGMIVYAFYMYSDFAGYTLIAIGSAALFGLKVCPNFKQPFLSSTIPEFWRRWHMSLSFWVRDYIFIPLRTSWRKLGAKGMYTALFMSFAVFGAWHGPKWGFVLFGMYHGALAILSMLTLPWRNKFWAAVRAPMGLVQVQRQIATFFLFAFSLSLFATSSLQDAWYIVHTIFSAELLVNIRGMVEWRFFHRGAPVVLGYLNNRPWALIPLVIIGDLLAQRNYTLSKFPLLVRIPIYTIGLIEIFGTWMDIYVTHPFVYNKF